MANKIFIMNYNDYTDVDIFSITEDIGIEAISKFSSFSEVVPTFSDVIDQATSISAGAAGSVGAGLLESKNLFDIPRWKGTDPAKLIVKLFFENKTDPRADIFAPMTKLMGYNILTKNQDNTYQVPGISLNSLESFRKTGLNSNTLAKNSKLLSIAIPGVIYLPIAILERATPIISKEITESGFPLWGQLDCSFVGAFPATTEIFEEAEIWANSFAIPPIP